MIHAFLTGSTLAGCLETARQIGRVVEPKFDPDLTPYSDAGGWPVRADDHALVLRKRTSTSLVYDPLSDAGKDPRFAAELEFLRVTNVVCYVADSQIARMEANHFGVRTLSELFVRIDRDVSRIPVVFALNKRDLPNIESEVELIARLQWGGPSAYVLTIATQGVGIVRVIEEISRLGSLTYEATHVYRGLPE